MWKGRDNVDELIKRQDAIAVVAKLYRYGSDRMKALLEIPAVDIEKMLICKCDGCQNSDTEECMHCMRAYSDCYEV